MPQIDSHSKGISDYHCINHWVKGLPPKKFFLDESLPVKKYQELDSWYEEENKRRLESGEPYITHVQRSSYCLQDTEILCNIVGRTALQQYARHGHNPFIESSTITKYCFSIFLSRFLKPNSIAITPDEGFSDIGRGSAICDSWALALMHQNYDNKNTRFFWRRSGGEISVCGYRVDITKCDLDQRPDELSYVGITFYECNGVAFHGDPRRESWMRGNVFSDLTNAEEMLITQQRCEQLALLVTEKNVIFKTDIEVEQYLKELGNEAIEARLAAHYQC